MSLRVTTPLLHQELCYSPPPAFPPPPTSKVSPTARSLPLVPPYQKAGYCFTAYLTVSVSPICRSHSLQKSLRLADRIAKCFFCSSHQAEINSSCYPIPSHNGAEPPLCTCILPLLPAATSHTPPVLLSWPLSRSCPMTCFITTTLFVFFLFSARTSLAETNKEEEAFL